jgi:hypothetical protein
MSEIAIFRQLTAHIPEARGTIFKRRKGGHVREESVPNAIQAPELERMVAVLRKRAEQAKVTLPKDVAFYLAQNIRSSTRALEGALLRLIAHASMTGTAITLTYTRQVLKHFIDTQGHKVVDSFPRMPPEQSGTIETNIRRQYRVVPGHDFVFWLQTRDGRKNRRVRHELEVNMRESERERLARWDAYERGLGRRAKMRKQG